MRGFFYGILVGVVLGAVFAHYGERIVGSYGEVSKVQLRLDETNETLTALEKRVKNLEDMKALDEQRIADLEGKVNR
jgi:uncharacterized membrane protein (DUF106 family)